MSNYTLTEEIKKKWEPVLEHKSMPEIKDNYRKNVTTMMLENMDRFKRGQQPLHEAGEPTNITGGTQLGGTSTVANWDPVLVSLVRRSTPNLLAFDIAGVQAMTGPTGLMFALRSRYSTPGGSEALFDEANTAFSGTGTHDTFADFLNTSGGGSGHSVGALSSAYTGIGKAVNTAEGSSGWNQMGFSIEKTSVVAQTRNLKAEYSTELAQDLRAIHGLDAEAELANILTTEIMAEQNRELIRTVNLIALASGVIGSDPFAVDADGDGPGTTGKYGAVLDVSGVPTFNVDTVASAQGNNTFSERFKPLLFQLELECNAIAKSTRRGRGNYIITSSNVASALAMSGVLNYAPALQTNLSVDDTGNLFAGVLNGRIKVYIDPYATVDYVTIGYRGANQFDAGIMYCPYVPLEMVRALDDASFQPKIGFKTRYGVAANPFANLSGGAISGLGQGNATPGNGLLAHSNIYFRKFKVVDLI